MTRLRSARFAVIFSDVRTATAMEMEMQFKPFTLMFASSALVLSLVGPITALAGEPVVAPGASAPAAVTSPEQRIRILLSAYHDFPSRDDLLAVSPDASSILIDLFNDESSRPTLKRRAIDALGFLSDDVSQNFLVYLLQNDAQLETGYVHHAITAYSRLNGEGSIAELERFLQHDDPQIRLTAVSAARDFAGKAGQNLLESRLKLETNELVRNKIQKSL